MLLWPLLIHCKVLLLFSIFLEFCFIFRFWFAGYLPNLSWLSAGRLTRKLYAEISSCLTLDRVCAASMFLKGISPQLGVLIITIFSRPVRMNGSSAGLFVKASVLFVLYLLCQQTWSPAFDKNKNKMWVLICLVILLLVMENPLFPRLLGWLFQNEVKFLSESRDLVSKTVLCRWLQWMWGMWKTCVLN